MANPEHVAVVGRGADAIEAWRLEHPEEPLNLGEADLSGVNLRDANLRNANLFGAIVSGADLSDADLVGVNLSGADLSVANLIDANLIDANLTRAELVLTNLTLADLRGADLGGAYLRGTNLSEVRLFETQFADINLSATRGLAAIRHVGPSTLDHRTLVQSGELSLEFLRGVGLPDEVIEFYRTQYGKPIQFYSCFISYARRDEAFVDRLYADLQDNGVRCWRDTEDMKIGDRQRPVIDRAIRVHDKVVLVLSEHSIASKWVESEVEAAFERERRDPDGERTVLFPIRLDDSVMETDQAWAAEVRRTRHIGDFRRWKDHDSYRQAFERVLRDLRPDDS